MLYSEQYQTYKGPPLIKATLGEEDITDKMTELYGDKYNWKGYLRTYREAFGENCTNKNFRFDFKDSKGQDHWFHGFITDINQYFNPPLVIY